MPFTTGNNMSLTANSRYELDTKQFVNPLPAKTGGVLIQHNNFFFDGIGKETENMMKGYYLVSYTPPASTFAASNREKYYKVNVRVKRRGATVHTRDGFYNRTEEETGSDTKNNPLMDAIYSPFMYNGIDVNMTAGYVKAAGAGYLVRSWIHIDHKDVKIVETEDGGGLVGLEMIYLASGANGIVHDMKHVQYDFKIKPDQKAETLSWIQEHGIRFSMLLPVKNPGTYFIRVSVKNTGSDNIGSVHQYLEIPDLRKKGVTLSNIFMITSPGDLEWMSSSAAKELSEVVFFPVFQAKEIRSPALRTYTPGDGLQTLTVLYNADAGAVSRSEIEIQSVLHKGGKELMRGEPMAVNSDGAGNPDGVPVLQRLTLGPDMPPGDYVLQLVVTDKKNSKRQERNTTQSLHFTVVEK